MRNPLIYIYYARTILELSRKVITMSQTTTPTVHLSKNYHKLLTKKYRLRLRFTQIINIGHTGLNKPAFVYIPLQKKTKMV